jgi:hypothetical protein
MDIIGNPEDLAAFLGMEFKVPVPPSGQYTYYPGTTEVPERSAFSLCGEGLCIGYDGGDRVSTTYPHRFEFTGCRIVKVVFDVAEDLYIDVERHFAAAMARD